MKKHPVFGKLHNMVKNKRQKLSTDMKTLWTHPYTKTFKEDYEKIKYATRSQLTTWAETFEEDIEKLGDELARVLLLYCLQMRWWKECNYAPSDENMKIYKRRMANFRDGFWDDLPRVAEQAKPENPVTGERVSKAKYRKIINASGENKVRVATGMKKLKVVDIVLPFVKKDKPFTEALAEVKKHIPDTGFNKNCYNWYRNAYKKGNIG